MTIDLDLTGLAKRFGSTVALDDFNWSGGSGVIGLLGPNGAGKTTLLRMLATVLAPDRGSIRIYGLDPARSRDRLAIRRLLGYLPQHTGLYPGFSAFDLVDYVAVLKEIAKPTTRHEQVRQALCSVGLEDEMHRRIRTLSGGMKRRVAIAAALVGQPRLLVLDEPSAGLDPDQRLRLRDVVSHAGQLGTVVVSTHHTDEVAAFCQRVSVLDRGRLRFAGTPPRARQHGGRARGSTTIRTPTPHGAGSPVTALFAASARPRAERSSSNRTSTTATCSRRATEQHHDGPDTCPHRANLFWCARATRDHRSRSLLARVSIWIGLVLTVLLLASNTTADWPSGGYIEKLPQSFAPIVLGTFIAAFRTGRRDGEHDVAESAPIGSDHRALARLSSLALPIVSTVLVVVGFAVVSRIEGGFWLGDHPRRTDTAQHTVAELAQPVLIVAFVGAAGIAIGRSNTKRAMTTAVIAGIALLTMFAGYFLWNIPPAHVIAPVQTQPLFIDLDPATNVDQLPTTWFVELPDDGPPRRQLVHRPTILAHDLYLLGLTALAAGLAVRGSRGRRVALAGTAFATAGVVAQIIVSPL